jgi:hypothetical protein
MLHFTNIGPGDLYWQLARRLNYSYQIIEPRRIRARATHLCRQAQIVYIPLHIPGGDQYLCCNLTEERLRVWFLGNGMTKKIPFC